MKKFKNVILKTITYIAFVTFIAAIAFADSEDPIPFFVAMFVSLGWLYLFALANSRKGERHGKSIH